MIATNEEERKALEKIRKIVDGLGEDSYLSMAFEGCFEDAERNINEDAGYSMKDRYESACKDYDRIHAKYNEVNDACKAKDSEIARLNEEVEELKKWIYFGDDKKLICEMICDFKNRCAEEMNRAESALLDASVNDVDNIKQYAIAYKNAKEKSDAVDDFIYRRVRF